MLAYTSATSTTRGVCGPLRMREALGSTPRYSTNKLTRALQRVGYGSP